MSKTFAEDERAQELAEEIERNQKSADGEMKQLGESMSPRIKVGCAMQHARFQARADKARQDLIDYTGLAI